MRKELWHVQQSSRDPELQPRPCLSQVEQILAEIWRFALTKGVYVFGLWGCGIESGVAEMDVLPSQRVYGCLGRYGSRADRLAANCDGLQRASGKLARNADRDHADAT